MNNQLIHRPKIFWIAGLIALAIVIGASLYRQAVLHQRQAEVAMRGAQVMPFDLEKTTHHFEPLPDGGLQTVVADSPIDPEQVKLIQSHLKEETAKFQAGDFSDPAAIHGDAMPGLKQLRAGHRNMTVEYTTLPDGGQIRYTTQQPALVAAVHDWFAAQRSDHGHHAQ
ncbi:hypothetical protein [Leptothoe spongobia]|uniref:hypothetical protein n=1 Tax=Leptothoe spongobia TaxID=2651728 RepID=UPI001C016E83|nr:hypothetical protein [Leptothoe spongobia]